MHPRPFVVGVFLLLYDALPAGPTPCALHTSSSMFAKHGFLFLLCSIPRGWFVLKPETMLRTSEAQVGWRWRSCPWRAVCLLSMVFIQMGSCVKCRWFFGRVFSFPLVEEFV